MPISGEALEDAIVNWRKEVFDGTAVKVYGQTEADMMVGSCEALNAIR